MNPSKSEETIFCEALEVPPEQRARYLQDACGNDSELLAAVKGLLQLHDTEEAFLATPAIGISPAEIVEQPDDLIDCYQLENKIGEGGFGVVWQAQQLKPIKRQVAMKIVKLGMDSQTIVKRFDDERQTLAIMNHPNIATVLDAGVTEGGRSYFVMELVEGSSIDRFCKDSQLSIREQLAIFITVCRAVHHAHQKGIVHRDLKPSNILIATSDDQFVPKVIDFGIATAVQTKQALSSTDGVEHHLVGTPQFMSPEQWRREADIDTRSDIYSLGVVLYQLLAGSLPPSESQSTPNEFPRLSQWLLQSDMNRKVDDDLDWIIQKAMSFNRRDRYQSASEMAADLERYLRGETVTAHPGGTRYLLKKFVRRNRVAVTSGVLTFFALIGGIVASTWGMIYADEQREIAVQQKKAAQENEQEAVRLRKIAEAEAMKLRVVANVLKNMLPEANPYRGMKAGFQVRQHLDQLINSVDTLSSEPDLEADLRITAGRVYENMSRFGRARHQYMMARNIRREHLGEEHPKTLLCLAEMASCNIELGRLKIAENMVNEVLEKSERRAPRTQINALRTLRRIRDIQQRYAEAFEIAEQIRELSLEVHKNEIFGKIHVGNEYSIAAMRIGLKEEAEQEVRKSLKLLERDHPDRQFVIANTKHRLAEILLESKKYEEAKKHASDFVEMQKVTLGENDNYVIRGLVLLAEIHRRNEDLLVSEQLALDAVERAETLDREHVRIRRTAYRQLARVLGRIDLQRAAKAWETAIAHSWRLLGGDVSVASDLLRQARIFEKLEQLDSSEERVLRAIEILENRKRTEKKLADAYRFYAGLLKQLDRIELSEQFTEKADRLLQNAKQE